MANLCLIIGVLRSFIFSVIVDLLELMSAISFFVFPLSCFLFVFFFVHSYVLTAHSLGFYFGLSVVFLSVSLVRAFFDDGFMY